MNLSPQIPVAVFLTRFEPGGTERQMIELIRCLDRERFTVHVACLHREGAWLSRATERAASVVEFPIKGFARAATVAELMAFARWCRREHIAVVQTCDLYTNVLGLPGAALAGVPLRVGSRRELNPDKTAGQIRLQRQAYRCATKVVANSSAARRMLEAEGLATTSIAVIPNGVHVSPHDPGLDSTPKRRPRRVITVANLRPEKSHETLLDAAERLVPAFPDLEILIVGDGPRRAELERRVRDQALARAVRFLGHREDVADLLAAADVFVLPSRSEAFPNSAIEAMAAGLPVVASATGGLLDLIEHGRTGLLFEPGNAHALSDALGGVLADGASAARLGHAARAEVTARYSFERMVRAFEDLYLTGLPSHAHSGARRAQAAGI